MEDDEIVNDEDMLVLDDQTFKIYDNPLYVSSPTYPILEDIMGQRNEIMNNLIFSGYRCPTDTYMRLGFLCRHSYNFSNAPDAPR